MTVLFVILRERSDRENLVCHLCFGYEIPSLRSE